eukprot:CAMPEP_0115123588 /NCGR_PEP_ID=MMETSP0227-20121206/47639_1 /TAXON_ID=89957 /ORGANISM="Polarella glacialis, Strain CCMP 1383" /LENGTH=81 /DNA_ID=CAMNT_0002526003 /DNA_START=191 /DNA_END=437 /DNA_ORIENTATION=+
MHVRVWAVRPPLEFTPNSGTCYDCFFDTARRSELVAAVRLADCHILVVPAQDNVGPVPGAKEVDDFLAQASYLASALMDMS